MPEGGKSLSAKAICKLRHLGKFATSRKAIPVFKGVLAYIIAFILIFPRGFDDLSQVPITFTGTILIVIAGTPGKSVGACLTATFFAILGVCIGSLNFVILAHLGHEPVAQAVVFAVMVYLLALIKAQGLKYFGFSLLAILMGFNGIYTSMMLGTGFSSTYLKEYIKWGSAIVLFVNLFVFPVSSERELRKLLVMSLEHVATYSHLLAKTYTLTLTDEERDARARLAQTIRADFGLLTMKMAETSAEINWSRWSMDDYLALITSHTSISNIHSQNATLFKEYFLPSTLKPFQRMRRDIDIAIQEISEALGGPPARTTRPSECDTDSPPKDLEKSAVPGPTSISYPTTAGAEQDLRKRALLAGSSAARTATGNDTPAAAADEDEQDEIRERLRRVAARLAEEVANEGLSPAGGDKPLPTSATTALSLSTKTATASDHSDADHKQDHGHGSKPARKCTCGPSAILNDFNAFRLKQQELLGAALVCGRLHGGSSRLRLYEERKSVAQEEGRDWVRGEAEMRKRRGATSRATSVKASEVDREPSRPVSTVDFDLEEGIQDEEDDPKKVREDQMMTDTRQCLVRVYSLLYALNQFAHELSTFHEAVISRKTRPKRVHVHLFETLAGKVHKAERKRKERAQRPPISNRTPRSETGDMEIDNASQVEDRELCVREALAILEQQEYVPQNVNIWQKLERAKRLFESPTSIYAGKTAAATLIFAVLIWAPATRQWFINYGLTGGLITVVVALTPTLGQTLFTFVMQIAGSAVGYIMAIIVLEAFKDVGGYRFNPYGITCLVGLFAIPFQYLIYEKPMYFTLALLALNGTGVIVVTEWTVQQYQGRHNYDSPPYRAGKALSSLAVALAIVGTFQLVVLRNPARRQLRESTARIVYGLLGYNTILQAYVRATMPADPAFRAPQAALERVEHDLRHREMKLQTQLIEVMPLLMFANSEPQLAKHRYREARAAIGTTPFDEYIIEEFISVLSPYRRRFTRTIKTSFYLFPLPHDIQGVTDWQADFIHDALVLSTRMARSETGANSVKSEEFSRYWYYLLTVSTIGEQLKEMEAACKELFGELEDHPRSGIHQSHDVLNSEGWTNPGPFSTTAPTLHAIGVPGATHSIDASFDAYIQRKESLSEASHDLMPLSVLETALAVGENMHKVGFHTGNKIFPVLMKTIRGYTDIHKGEILSHYYGLLCVRHLIRMVCIGTLKQNKMLDPFLEELKPSMERVTVADRLAEKALGCMSKALYTEDLSNVADALGCSKKTGTAFVLEGGLGFRDVRFLVDVVWKSRKAIIPLRRDEILPGLPALFPSFYVCYRISSAILERPTRPWGKLQDILLRCYLGDTSLPERAILRQLAIFLHHRIQEYKIPEDYVPVDQEDFCAIAGAWSDMLTPPLDLALAPVMLLDVSIILFRWIFRLMANPRENEGTLVAEWLAPAIMAGGFERLRLEIDRERDGPMALPRRGFTRNYAAELFGHSSVIGKSIQSSAVKDKFVQTLYELDFHELAGRVLLLVTREDVNQYTENEPDKLMHYIESLDRISEALNDALPPHSPNLSEINGNLGATSPKKVLREEPHIGSIPMQLSTMCGSDSVCTTPRGE
ncbi:hypothetical protein RHS02_09900, partial [Rhizoctonia solani]